MLSFNPIYPYAYKKKSVIDEAFYIGGKSATFGRNRFPFSML